jgi:hypothetical protein
MSEYNEEKVIKEILKDVNGDIEKLNGEDLGLYLLSLRNEFHKNFKEIVKSVLLKTPIHERDNMLENLSDMTSVYGIDIKN